MLGRTLDNFRCLGSIPSIPFLYINQRKEETMNNQKDNYMDFVPENSVVDMIEPSLTTIHAKSIEKALIDAINYEMKQIGNTDVKITNIRPFITDNKQFAFADVSYTWWLNSWDNKVVHKDMIFALVDVINNRWTSPIFR